LLLSPTASGKSLIIYLITRYLNESKCLIIVPNISLVTQLASDFADYGLDADKYVHRIFAGQDKEAQERVTITTEVGSQYTFDCNQDIKILNSNVKFKKAKDITIDDEIDDRWLQEQKRK
jgi:superfamily II DNA or RNA helicase